MGGKACDKCGNEYNNNFVVLMDGERYQFDCFECAISKLAPRCAHCETVIIGHGVEEDGKMYCCNHCSLHREFHKENIEETHYRYDF